VGETKAKILQVLNAIPHGVLYSTTDWHRLLGEDKREIRLALDELEVEGKNRDHKKRPSGQAALQAQGGRMMSVRYVTDENGNRIAVLLDTKEYERMVEELEDIADARAADEVRGAVACSDDEFIVYEQTRKEIARRRAANR
jgi:hypothetical protein